MDDYEMKNATELKVMLYKIESREYDDVTGSYREWETLVSVAPSMDDAVTWFVRYLRRRVNDKEIPVGVANILMRVVGAWLECDPDDRADRLSFGVYQTINVKIIPYV